MTKKYDVQLAIGATQAGGTQRVESQQVLSQRHLAFKVSATPAAGSLAVYGRTIGAQDWSLITTIDMTLGSQLIPMMGLFDQFQCIPTGFDAGKSYWLTVTTADSGLYAPVFPKAIIRNTIASGVTASKNVNINSHNLLGQHQLQIDVVGTAAGSVAVFGKPLNGALVPLGTIQLASGPRHILFRGYFDGLQLVPSGLTGGASVNATLVSVEDGLLGPDLEMLMPMSTGNLTDRMGLIWSAAKGMFVPTRFLRRGALYNTTANNSVATGLGSSTALSFQTGGGKIYDTDGIFSSAAPTAFTVPVGVSAIKFSANVVWASNATGVRAMHIFKNGADFAPGFTTVGPAASGTNSTLYLATPSIDVLPGDVFTVIVQQNSGGALAVNSGNFTWACMEILY